VALMRFHVPFDNAAHVFMLGSEPGYLAIDHAGDEDPA
jgi:hypothetical protein